MPRKLSDSLMSKLLTGEYKEILNFVKNDSELSFQIRTSSVAMIYYKKSRVLSLYSRRIPNLISPRYCKEKNPIPLLDIKRPNTYFSDCKKCVDDFVKAKNNIEFSIQQKIATDNSSLNNPYLVVDMEYQFEQNKIVHRIKKKTRFDLVAIEHSKNKIVLLEIKQGFASSLGKAGVNDHINRFQEHFIHPEFGNSLRFDIVNIIKQKIELGLLSKEISSVISYILDAEIEIGIAFAFNNNVEKDRYTERYGSEREILFVDIAKPEFILK